MDVRQITGRSLAETILLLLVANKPANATCDFVENDPAFFRSVARSLLRRGGTFDV